MSTKEGMQSVTIEGDSVIFSRGETELITVIKLDLLLLQHKGKILSAAMTGIGGDTASAYYIKYRLQKTGVTETRAYGGICNSACTIIWTAGQTRKVEGDFYLGFHQTCSFKFLCESKLHIYDGFLSREIVNILVSPNGSHACPLGGRDIAILEGEESQERKSLVTRIEYLCLNNGLTGSELKAFKGYDSLPI